jgi:predicted DCC family thiol-disulfide oxidoreductase YuxK
MPAPAPNSVVLYDGVCGLCNWLVQFVLKRDLRGRFRFASLESPFAAKILTKYGVDSADLDTMCTVLDYDQPGESLAVRSDAAVAVLLELGGIWHSSAMLLRVLPRSLRDWGYDLIARNRYRMFGKYDSCPLPDGKYRNRFLDG